MKMWVVALFAGLMMALTAAVPAHAGIDVSNDGAIVTDLGAGNYSFSHAGWYNGGVITGTFVGIDLDGDLQLNSYFHEISEFTASFAGNAKVAPFSLCLCGLYGLVFDLDGGNVLGDGIDGFDAEGLFATGGATLYGIGTEIGAVCGEGEPCAVIATIPEPANWSMLIAGFGLVGAMMRRQAYRAV